MTQTTLSPEKLKRIASSPYLFAANFLKIQDKDDNLAPLVLNELQIDYLKKRTPRDLILKPRQIGFSTAIQAEIFRYSITRPTRSLTLTDESANTTKMRLMQQKFYDHMPEQFRPERSVSNATLTIYPEYNSELLSGTAGNTKVGRAGSYRVQHYSEIGFYKDAGEIMKSALQGGRPMWVVAESTPNGAQGWFFERCMDAIQNPDSVWKLHFYTWFNFPEYQLPLERGETLVYDDEEMALIEQYGVSDTQLKWRRFKIGETDKNSFLQEYPNDPISCFLTSGGGVFTLRPENIYTGNSPRMEGDKTYYMQAPVKGVRYVAGMDWGQDNDYTTLSVWRVDVGEAPCEVYVNRWRKQDWYVMRGYAIDVMAEYGVEKAVVEKNAASSNIENLSQEIESRGLDISIQPFKMSNFSKDKIVKLLQNGLAEHGSKVLGVDYANHEMRTYQTKQTPTGLWSYTHPDGGHDDCVDARLLANYAATQLWI